jgi:type IV secretory pathway VirB4 component
MAIHSKASQDFVPIEDIHDGVVILKDKSMKMILMASSINFALKSQEEQIGIIMQFQNFLNSLEFTTQIYIQSRRLDIKPYLALLQSRLSAEISDLMRVQIQEYIEFVRSFTDNSNIMSKTFFIVIPYYPGATLNFSKKQDKKKEDSILERFEEGKSQLEQRSHIIKQGLARCGVRVVPLGTEEVVELFYKIFNPSDTGRGIKLTK